MAATRARLEDKRWHFQHGPIDLVIEPFGTEAARARVIARGWRRFQTVLDELVAELAFLRAPVQEAEGVTGPVARRMLAACRPHGRVFITPMAAVAGSVADEMVAAMALEDGAPEDGLARLYVNNGGDIAFWLAPGERMRIGLIANPEHASALDGAVEIGHHMPVRGVATSGWRGRSFSLGIADSVTVLAASGASADAAATLIANEVDCDHPAVVKRPANEIKDDTDLGALPVTVAVGPLPRALVDRALARGVARAEALRREGFIWGAVLSLAGDYRIVGDAGSAIPALPMRVA
ncbi:MAG TPA: UPF0280 family protein [Alphaproteobacteria bacterium]|nr:UPF0280 family protein [Alphaproteobacteria bacterium]